MGKAASFTGASGQYIDCGGGSVAVSGNTITVESWAKAATLVNEYAAIVGDSDYTAATPVGFALIRHASINQTYFQTSDASDPAGAGNSVNNGNGTSPLGTWQFLVGTLNAASTAGNIYTDASPNSNGSWSGNVGTSAHPVSIGYLPSSGAGANAYFDGQIDEVRISNVVRSQAWISTEYAPGNAPAPSDS